MPEQTRLRQTRCPFDERSSLAGGTGHGVVRIAAAVLTLSLAGSTHAMAATTDYRDISEIRTRCIIAGIAHQPIASVFPVMGPRRTVTLDHAGRITAGELTLQASAPHKTSVCIENAVQRWMRDYTIRINRGSTQLKDSGAGGRARPLAYVVAQGASALTLGVGMTGRPLFALTHSATRLSTALAEGWKDAHRGVSSYYFASVGGQSTVVNSLSTGARSSRNSTDYVLRYRITLMGEHGELFTLERKSGPRRAPYQASKKCRVTVAPKRELKAETTQKRGAPASKPIGQISSKAASTVPLRGGRR